MTKHSQPSDAITEEALMEMGFDEDPWSSRTETLLIKYEEPGVEHLHAYFKDGAFVGIELHFGVDFPGCRTMQDLKTLIRLLGGAQ